MSCSKFVKIALILCGLAVFSAPAGAVSLKSMASVDSDTLRLDDIFNDLERSGDKVLGPAPRPGEEMVLNSRTLLRIALALDLPWRPASATDSVTVKRVASIVPQDMIETALQKAFTEKGLTGKYNVGFTQKKMFIALPKDIAPSVEVTTLALGADNRSFEATLSAPSTQNPVRTTKISGTLEQLARVPVLKEAMNNESVIGAQDIDYMDVSMDLVKNGMVLKAVELVGMAPRRLISAGKPVQTADIRPPRMVERGDTVTMIFKDGALLLTAQGKALDNGAKGDQIRVVNIGSNKTIDAIVSAGREVTIQNF